MARSIGKSRPYIFQVPTKTLRRSEEISPPSDALGLGDFFINLLKGLLIRGLVDDDSAELSALALLPMAIIRLTACNFSQSDLADCSFCVISKIPTSKAQKEKGRKEGKGERGKEEVYETLLPLKKKALV